MNESANHRQDLQSSFSSSSSSSSRTSPQMGHAPSEVGKIAEGVRKHRGETERRRFRAVRALN